MFFVLFIYRQPWLVCHGSEEKRIVFAKQGKHTHTHTDRQAMVRAQIIADNLLLCIAFSKDGSTVYPMFQQKKTESRRFTFLLLFFSGTIFKKKRKSFFLKTEREELMMMGVRLCDYTANAQISMLQLILCDIVCFHSKCK